MSDDLRSACAEWMKGKFNQPVPLDSLIAFVQAREEARDKHWAKQEMGVAGECCRREKERDALRSDMDQEIELHANLNRRAAKALGKPFEGKGSTWSDIPECIEALRAEVVAVRSAVGTLTRERDEARADLSLKHQACQHFKERAEAAEAKAAEAEKERDAARVWQQGLKDQLALVGPISERCVKEHSDLAATAYASGAREMRERAAKQALRPYIHDAMRGIVAVADFGPEIAAAIRALPIEGE